MNAWRRGGDDWLGYQRKCPLTWNSSLLLIWLSEAVSEERLKGMVLRGIVLSFLLVVPLWGANSGANKLGDFRCQQQRMAAWHWIPTHYKDLSFRRNTILLTFSKFSISCMRKWPLPNNSSQNKVRLSYLPLSSHISFVILAIISLLPFLRECPLASQILPILFCCPTYSLPCTF